MNDGDHVEHCGDDDHGRDEEPKKTTLESLEAAEAELALRRTRLL